MKRHRLLQLASAFVLCLGPAVASADIMFSGSWSPTETSGTIDPGVTWRTTDSPDSFGVPGLGFGTTPWPGPDGFVDFHISFQLPTGVDISAVFGTHCSGFDTTTRFCVEPFLLTTQPWTPVLDGPDAISFFANPGQSLDNGDRFFFNIIFTGDAPSGSFTGSWTTVPEPGTLALLGMVLAALGFGQIRRRTSLA